MSKQQLFKAFHPEGLIAFTGLTIPQMCYEYSSGDLRDMHIFEWTGVMDWRGINIYRGDKVAMNLKDKETFIGYVEYCDQLCRYIVKSEKSYDDLSHSAMSGNEDGIKLLSVEIIGNLFTTPKTKEIETI